MPEISEIGVTYVFAPFTHKYVVKSITIISAANRIAWIRRLAKLQDNAFVKVLQKRLRIKITDLIKIKIDHRWVRSRIVPEFYKEIVVWIDEIDIIKEPDSAQLIRLQPIWHNA